jgi:hypothetical protein
VGICCCRTNTENIHHTVRTETVLTCFSLQIHHIKKCLKQNLRSVILLCSWECHNCTSVIFMKIRGTSGSIEARLRPGRLRCDSGTSIDGIFALRHRIQTGLGAHPSTCLMGTGFLIPGVKHLCVKLTTHLHLGPRLRMSGAKHPLPQNVFIAW